MNDASAWAKWARGAPEKALSAFLRELEPDEDELVVRIEKGEGTQRFKGRFIVEVSPEKDEH